MYTCAREGAAMKADAAKAITEKVRKFTSSENSRHGCGRAHGRRTGAGMGARVYLRVRVYTCERGRICVRMGGRASLRMGDRQSEEKSPQQKPRRKAPQMENKK